ncbi:XkdX family protein [Paenibacillus sp. OSY-SE]|nr:XkdX family protein [Paenibacillus sp. OSY-SE]
MFENDYERLKYFCDKGWCSVTQLQQYVGFKVITPEQYKLITGQKYQAK